MDGPELRLQRLFDRVELVSDVGDPAAGTMCIMSLVARLAGEGHTDDPPSASPLIRAFAIPINDRMPHEVRQRLKPFAPRILGTRDGLDRMRAAVLHRVLTAEVLPRMVECRTAAPGRRRSSPRRLWFAVRRNWLRRRVRRLMDEVETGSSAGLQIALAYEAGQLLALCARCARGAHEAEWYWSAAIGLLDRLCEVGVSGARNAPGGARVDRLLEIEPILRPNLARYRAASA
jgi:hypothetical protein